MAKISANHASEVARIETAFSSSRRLFILTSDGRILTRFTHPTAENFKLLYRGISVPASHADREEILSRIAARMGYKVVDNGR